MWGVIVGWFLGRGIGRAAGSARLPEAEKQRRYDEAEARRAARRERRRWDAWTWGVLAVLVVLGLLKAILG